ncbi:DUF397 domain-containing protein [Actinokineospora sp.]|uniref:DUF397 domain-containing protein n=1 Tax=Actinokineospora sp. TaxID=1872133 RepID=UPI003D6C15DD
MNTVDLTSAAWRKSSRSSGNGACVEVAFVGNRTATRDSKNAAGPTLVFPAPSWSAFVVELAHTN